MPYIKIPDTKVKIFYSGKKPKTGEIPVLFIHGAGGTHERWLEQEKSLSAPYIFAALDLPGHGKSSGSTANRTVIYRDYIRAFAKQLNFPPFVLAGHSLGGAIVLDYALTYPQDLRGIILIGTGARLRVIPDILNSCRRGEHYKPFFKMLFGSAAPPELINEIIAQLKTVDPLDYYADLIACDHFDVMNFLNNIAIPAFIIVGKEDKVTPVKYSAYLEKNLPQSKMVIISGAGHMVMIEKPEETNKAISEFLESIKD